MKTKQLIAIGALVASTFGCGPQACSSCGISQPGTQVTGQIKRVFKTTHVFCDPMDYVDISLGVMNNGVGSVSKEDMTLLIQDPEQIASLKGHIGSIVMLTYDERRIPPPCAETGNYLTEAKFLETAPSIAAKLLPSPSTSAEKKVEPIIIRRPLAFCERCSDFCAPNPVHLCSAQGVNQGTCECMEKE